MPQRPGLAKVKSAPLVRRRRADLVAPLEGRWREIIETADVVSEGKPRDEGGTLFYYGSTSILLRAGELVDEDLEELAAILRHDPHTRVRAIRVARREAATRASAPLGSMRAEILVRATSDGVLVTVDVVARMRKTGLVGTRR